MSIFLLWLVKVIKHSGISKADTELLRGQEEVRNQKQWLYGQSTTL